MKKKKNNWGKKVYVTLSESDIDALRRYADAHHQAPAVAIRQVLRRELADYIVQKEKGKPDNQLGLFDSLQIDIFNNTARVCDDDDE
ncbi:MAG: hypothetical protein Q4D03_04610 [Bacteroidales bacterium]|nr:hypothetical protein [Bacteroidales bacterium]